MGEECQNMEINDSNNSDESSDDDEEEQKLIARAEELERDISSNKYLYEAHIELVDIYRKLGDLTSMREAYERFHSYFPLTPKLWLAWIKDEIKLAGTPEQQKQIFKLFDLAVEDYISVELWVEYAQYSIGVSDMETTRSILERGLTAAGLHCTEACLLWDTLRELENAYISLHVVNSDEWRTQVNRLADVFKRQLSVPLVDMENTYNEWQNWVKSLPEGTVNTEPVEWGYKKSFKLLEQYKPFEERLLTTEENDELYNIYKEYIKSVSDPSTIICLYERAALRLCLEPNLWLDYCMYVCKLGETATKVSVRAIRNCPWSEELWVAKLRILEIQEKPYSEVLQCFEEAAVSVNSPALELWLSYIEYVHRNSPDKLDKLIEQAIHQLGIPGDPTFKLHRLHARILAHKGEIQSARKLWKFVLGKPPNKETASLWLELINLERQYGDISSVRNAFQRAITVCTDWPQYIAEEWLMYERQFGTLGDVLKCIEKCKEKNKNEPKPSFVQDDNKSEETVLPKGKKRKHNLQSESTIEHKKIKNEKDQQFSQKYQTRPKPQPVEKDPKKTVFVSNLHPHVNEEILKKMFPDATIISIVYDPRGKSKCYGYIQFTREEEVMTALARDREPLDGRPVFISELKTEKNERNQIFKYANNIERNKLFVRGLPIKMSKEEVESIFKKYGAQDVRLVLHKSGQPKGLAYIEFETEEAAQKALKDTDQMEIDGKVITVAISAPPPKRGNTDSHTVQDEPIRHARSRLQVPLIPRSLQVKNSENKETNGSRASPKTNADFRNMLLKK